MAILRILKDNRIVSAGQVSSDDEISVYLKDGSIRSKVIEVGEAWQKLRTVI